MSEKTRTITEKEFNRLWEESRKCDAACELIADLLDCGSRDADEVLRLIKVHGSDVIDESNEFAKDCGMSQNFGTIIQGVKRVVMFKLRDEVKEAEELDEENQEEDLDEYNEWINELIIDDNYIAWGAIYSYGSCPEAVGEIFAEILTYGLTDELKANFIKSFKEARGGDEEENDEQI